MSASLQELANVRRQISDISAKIQEIESASLTKQDVEERVRGFIQNLQFRFDHSFVGMAIVSPDGGLSATDILNACSIDETSTADRVLVLQAWLDHAGLERKLLACAEPYLASGKSAIPSDKRPALLKKLDGELSALLHQEEELILALTDAGHEVFRRANIDPLIVLAASTE